MRKILFVTSCMLLATVGAAEQMGYGVCAGYGQSGAKYLSAAFEAPLLADAWHTQSHWDKSFADYLKQKYGEKEASGSCSLLGSLPEAEAQLRQRVQGSRFGKPIETGWVLGAKEP